ncbi:hypothetical protein PINS_up018988 [Pythium insidiosum]|nr:hypothetical protein PINS_up018988 [Pythium insidiosum]
MSKKKRAFAKASTVDTAVGARATGSLASPRPSASPSARGIAASDVSASVSTAADGPTAQSEATQTSSDPATDKSKRRNASTLRSLTDHYDALVEESRRLTQRLDLLQWVLDSVAVVLTSGIIVELSLPIEPIQTQHILVTLAAALWLGRVFLLERWVSLTRLMRTAVWRTLVLAIAVGAMSAMLSSKRGVEHVSQSLIIQLLLLGLLDIAAIIIAARQTSNTQTLSYGPLAIAMLERLVVLMTTASHVDQREFLLYDNRALVLVILSACGHVLVVNGIERAVFLAPRRSKCEELRSRERAASRLERARSEVDKLLLSRHKIVRPPSADSLGLANVGTPTWSEIASASHLQLMIWMGVQSLFIVVQLVSTTSIVYSWELISVMMGFSALLLWEVRSLDSKMTSIVVLEKVQLKRDH